MLGYKLTKIQRLPRHPQNDHPYELAFQVDGEKFYKFADLDHLTTYARYEYVQKYFEMFQLKLTPESLKDLFGAQMEISAETKNEMIELLADGDATGALQLAANRFELFGKLASEGYERSQHLSSLNAAYHVAAQVFFKLDDDLRNGIEGAELDRRVHLFKKKEVAEVLYIEPMASLCNYQPLIEAYGEAYLTKHLRTLQALQSGQQRNWKRLAGGM